jgi:CheY-like chemotaxis protein
MHAEEHGSGMVVAGGGLEALATLERHDGASRRRVTDVVMPGLDRPRLGALPGERRPSLPALYLSGYPDDEVVRRGLLDAGGPFLQQPLTPDALLRRVGELLDQHCGAQNSARPLSSRVTSRATESARTA